MIVTIEGVDKTGKNLLHKYLEILTNYRYVITDRGILTQLVYNTIYNRQVEYNVKQYKNQVIVLLYADLQDLVIRHKLTDEPHINIENHTLLFDVYANKLKSLGFTVIKFNTSKMTPYAIAKKLSGILPKLEEKHEF